MSYKPSMIRKVYDKVQALPQGMRLPAMSFVFGNAVKYFRTSKLKFTELSPNKSVCYIKNRTRIQNHIGGVHAVAMGLIAESATGVLVGLNAPASSIPVIKSMHVDYLKRAVGDMRAEASLSDEQIEQIQTQEKGEVLVTCNVFDAEAKEPIKVQMLWAWVPAKRN